MDYAMKGVVFNVLFADCVFVADNSPQATRLGIATKDQFLFLKCDSSFTLVCPEGDYLIYICILCACITKNLHNLQYETFFCMLSA